MIIPCGLHAVPGPVTNLSATWKAFIMFLYCAFDSSHPFLGWLHHIQTERPPRTPRHYVRLRLSISSYIVCLIFMKFGIAGVYKNLSSKREVVKIG
jgi:hypothetical protein